MRKYIGHQFIEVIFLSNSVVSTTSVSDACLLKVKECDALQWASALQMCVFRLLFRLRYYDAIDSFLHVLSDVCLDILFITFSSYFLREQHFAAYCRCQ